ncbi:hypothetical protein LK07_32925 [Streptomyces pluripotens]|uniref:Uncharacterized protein n=1 Tax=Streptomyces pluripotens TaxID=1355015 RepID=A0A221P6X5_9ACTN|nr:hypothetical protein LK06_031725 [Streptomyces pluripotens]ASN28019.1 hypothetical protein LK07_32925 [Streptomyces pluripotens]
MVIRMTCSSPNPPRRRSPTTEAETVWVHFLAVAKTRIIARPGVVCASWPVRRSARYRDDAIRAAASGRSDPNLP